MATERYDGRAPVNLGSGAETRLLYLARMIAEVCGFKGTIEWDSSRPDGQPRRVLNVHRATRDFGFTSYMTLHEGIRRTVAWLREQT